ncbi:MAG TPA: hypothetical protein VK302_11055 [Terriglobales bacterium]|nr:hypothetical protein [Terriglobales bacterium]
MLRLTPNIDHAQAEFFSRLRTLPTKEQEVIHAAILCGAQRDLIEEIPDVLMTIDPVLCGLWAQWQETLSTEAWRAVVRLAFIKRELLTTAQTQPAKEDQ